jgi:hypothetical protein
MRGSIAEWIDRRGSQTDTVVRRGGVGEDSFELLEEGLVVRHGGPANWGRDGHRALSFSVSVQFAVRDIQLALILISREFKGASASKKRQINQGSSSVKLKVHLWHLRQMPKMDFLPR